MSSITFSEAWSGTADCRNCALRATALFAGLDELDFERIHTPIQQHAFSPGTALYRTGDPGQDMFTIRKGLVKLVTYLPDGAQRIVRLLHPSDVSGLETLTGDDYHHDAIALQPTEVCRFPSDLVKRLSRDNPKLYDELMRRWKQELAKADLSLVEFSTGSARHRVARFLLQLHRDSANEKITLFSREDLGAVLGITTETASRVIAEFKRQGLVCEAQSNVFLCDVPNLSRLLDS